MSIPPPMVRIEMIRESKRAFFLSFFSLIPIVGLPIAVLVLGLNWRTRRRARGMWNPGAHFLHWGGICASWGAGLSSFVAVIAGMFAAISNQR